MSQENMIEPEAIDGSSQDNHYHALACMEIWGGNQAIENGLATPGIDAWVISRVYQDAGQGGDIHYISQCGSGRISRFMVADVAGHGEHVGALGQRLRDLMRKNINTVDQTRFARALNRAFAQEADAGRFATALLTTYFSPSDQLVVCNAGHPRPLWYKAATGRWHPLDHDMPGRAELSNLPLGIIEPTHYHQFVVELAPDDLVVIYTDSLIEARGAGGEALGETGLLELVGRINTNDPAEMARRIFDDVQTYRDHAPPDDDQTIIVLHHNGEEPARPTAGELVRVLGKMMGLVKV